MDYEKLAGYILAALFGYLLTCTYYLGKELKNDRSETTIKYHYRFAFATGINLLVLVCIIEEMIREHGRQPLWWFSVIHFTMVGVFSLTYFGALGFNGKWAPRIHPFLVHVCYPTGVGTVITGAILLYLFPS